MTPRQRYPLGPVRSSNLAGLSTSLVSRHRSAQRPFLMFPLCSRKNLCNRDETNEANNYGTVQAE